MDHRENIKKARNQIIRKRRQLEELEKSQSERKGHVKRA